jgi:lipopolysaccharide export system ATP-binding protein
MDITEFPMYKRAQYGIGYLAQEASVFRKLSIEDNILSVLQLTKLSKEAQIAKMESLIAEFSLEHIRTNRGDLLSGGERRRTEIARALATDPKFILLDEPFAGVDPVAVEDIQRIVAQLKNKNIGILITDHNVQETLAITDKTYLMFEGGILKAGVPEELAADEMVRKVYLGQNFGASLHCSLGINSGTNFVRFAGRDKGVSSVKHGDLAQDPWSASRGHFGGELEGEV